MGTDYDCGCRESMGHVFLCDKHRRLMEGIWEKEKMDVIQVKLGYVWNERLHKYVKKLDIPHDR